ncbi:hypothetical protein ACS0TY_016115 [Phlomoides rotata]
MTVEELEVRDRNGRTALHTTAITGNTAAARILVDRHPPMLYMTSEEGWFHIHDAAKGAHGDIIEFLLSRTANPSPIADYKCTILLSLVIDADFYNMALRLVGKYPHMAGKKSGAYTSALERLSLKKMAFPSGDDFWDGALIPAMGVVRMEDHLLTWEDLVADQGLHGGDP